MQYLTLPSDRVGGRAWSWREGRPPEPPRPRLLERVRQAMRARHLSRRTEEAYVAWIRRFIFFHHKALPMEMGADKVTAFLTSLAVQANVVAATQNQSVSALLFLRREGSASSCRWGLRGGWAGRQALGRWGRGT